MKGAESELAKYFHSTTITDTQQANTSLVIVAV